MNKEKSVLRLTEAGIRPSVQRVAIMNYLLTHCYDHPTVEDVYSGLVSEITTLSRTTVYNTLRMFADHKAALMITIDEHRVCYDGDVHPHVHFYCKKCGKVFDLMDEKAPSLKKQKMIDGHIIDEEQLYYKGICRECAAKEEHNNN